MNSDANKFNLDETILNDQIATNDVIGNMIIQYKNLKDYFIKHLEAEEGLHFYSNGLFDQYHDIKDLKTVDESCYHKSKKERFKSFCDQTKFEIWKHVIGKLGIEKLMTHQVRQNFAEYIKQQGAMDFTRENVFAMIKTLIINKTTILENAVVDVFNIFTKYHKDNRCHVEGWKTNDTWKVNRRIILPWYVSKGWDHNYHENFRNDSEYSDIDKVMCYLTGIDFDYVLGLGGSIKDTIRKTKIGDSSEHESYFFNMRCYKKGTLHLEFKDQALWHEFNMRACAEKKWLPEAEEKAWREKKKEASRPAQPATLFFGT